jgi:methionine sulfoxide reductase heme-binding subunit
VPKMQAARAATPDAWLKPGLLIGGLVPLIVTALRAWLGTLGANPINTALNQFGLLALLFLIASLSATPLKLIFALTWPLRVRRMLGLFAFFYASLHLLTYVALDRLGELSTIAEDLIERPFITVGFFAFCLLVPLALTSTRNAPKQLGFKRWQQLHRLSYLVALLAIVHFIWRVKRDLTQPVLYAVILALLLAARLPGWLKQRERARYRRHADA